MKKTITLITLLALAGCSTLFDEVEPPERREGPFEIETVNGGVVYAYINHPVSLRGLCPDGHAACAKVYLDDAGKPVDGTDCNIYMMYIDRQRWLEHEWKHCSDGAYHTHLNRLIAATNELRARAIAQ